MTRLHSVSRPLNIVVLHWSDGLLRRSFLVTRLLNPEQNHGMKVNEGLRQELRSPSGQDVWTRKRPVTTHWTRFG